MLFDENKLVNGCKKGDRVMQKTLYDTYAPKMLGVCLRYASDRELAKDMLQEGFIKVFTNINNYKGIGSFEGWLRKIFVNTALEYLRKNDVLKNTKELDGFDQNAFVDSHISVLEQLSANELMEFISSLPSGYRTVFNLFAVEGYSHKEIGEMLGITESTSRSQYVRAKQILQKKLITVNNIVKEKVV